MTLEDFYRICRSGSRILDYETQEEIHIDQHTKTWLYDVVNVYAVENDLVFVEVRQ